MAGYQSDGRGNYFIRRRAAEEQTGDKTLNLQMAMAERLGKRTNILGEGMEGGGPFGPGYEAIEAPTTNPAWPRARILGYNQDTETLVVVFRDRTWVMYTKPVSLSTWEAIKGSSSTGTALADYGIDELPWVDVTMQPNLLPRK